MKDMEVFAEKLFALHTPSTPDLWARYNVPKPEVNSIPPDDPSKRLSGANAEQVLHATSSSLSDKHEAIVGTEQSPTPIGASGFETATKIAKRCNMTPEKWLSEAIDLGLIYKKGTKSYHITEKGRQVGAEQRKGKYGYYIAWPEGFSLNQAANNKL